MKSKPVKKLSHKQKVQTLCLLLSRMSDGLCRLGLENVKLGKLARCILKCKAILTACLVSATAGESITIGIDCPTNWISVSDTNNELILTVDGFEGTKELKRPKSVSEIKIHAWDSDGNRWEAAWAMPFAVPKMTNTTWASTANYTTNNPWNFATNPMPHPRVLARITDILATNWTTIGTFTPLTGPAEDVQRGNLSTNTTAIIEWKGKRFELLLESATGTECGERRIPKPVIAITNTWPQWWSPGKFVTNGIYLGTITNINTTEGIHFY